MHLGARGVLVSDSGGGRLLDHTWLRMPSVVTWAVGVQVGRGGVGGEGAGLARWEEGEGRSRRSSGGGGGMDTRGLSQTLQTPANASVVPLSLPPHSGSSPKGVAKGVTNILRGFGPGKGGGDDDSPRFVAECLGCKELEKTRARLAAAERRCGEVEAQLAERDALLGQHAESAMAAEDARAEAVAKADEADRCEVE